MPLCNGGVETRRTGFIGESIDAYQHAAHHASGLLMAGRSRAARCSMLPYAQHVSRGHLIMK